MHHDSGSSFKLTTPSMSQQTYSSDGSSISTQSQRTSMVRSGSATGSTLYNRRTAMMSVKRKSAYDERLQQQYVYFRMEFINAASNYGVTLPLDIMEDTSGRVINFIKQSGPEFLLQLLLTEIENIHLIRMALSLLVVTLSLLRRCIPQTDGGTADVSITTSFSQSSFEWLKTATKRLCDGGAVSVCVQLLLSTYLKDIHELIVGLLSQIVATSKEAAGQMLSPLNSHLDNIDAHGNHDFSRSPDVAQMSQRLTMMGPKGGLGNKSSRSLDSGAYNNSNTNSSSLNNSTNSETGGNGRIGTAGSGSGNVAEMSKETTCLSFLVSVCALYRNRLSVLASCADIMVSIAQAFPTHIVALRIAQTPTCTLSVISHVNGKSFTHGANGSGGGSGGINNNSSVSSSGSKAGAGRPGIGMGMASMNVNSPRSIAQGTMNGMHGLNNTNGGGGGMDSSAVYKSPRMTGSSLSSIGGGGERFCYDRSPELEQPTGSVAIPWAGIKLMLRVVMRIITFHRIPNNKANDAAASNNTPNSNVSHNSGGINSITKRRLAAKDVQQSEMDDDFDSSRVVSSNDHDLSKIFKSIKSAKSNRSTGGENTSTNETEGSGGGGGGGVGGDATEGAAEDASATGTNSTVDTPPPVSAVDTPQLLQRVFYCIAYLMSLSPDITAYLLTVPGAENLLKLAAEVIKGCDHVNEDMMWALETTQRSLEEQGRLAYLLHKRSNNSSSGSHASLHSSQQQRHNNHSGYHSTLSVPSAAIPAPNYKAAGAQVKPLYLTPIENVTVKQMTRGLASSSMKRDKSSNSLTSSNTSIKSTSPSAGQRMLNQQQRRNSPGNRSLSSSASSSYQQHRAGTRSISPAARAPLHHRTSPSPPRSHTAPHKKRNNKFGPLNVMLVSDFYSEARNHSANMNSLDGDRRSSSSTSPSRGNGGDAHESVKSAQSVSWLFKATAQRPQLPVVVIGQSSPVHGLVQSSTSPSHSPSYSPLTLTMKPMTAGSMDGDSAAGIIGQNASKFDHIADKELVRLLKKGYYVHGRPLSPISRSEADLKLGITVPSKSRGGTGAGERNSSAAANSHSQQPYDFEFDFDYSNFESLNQNKDNDTVSDQLSGSRGSNPVDFELRSLGLHTENSEETPFVMDKAQPQYSLDIKPNARAREFTSHLQYPQDELSTVSSVHSTTSSASAGSGTSLAAMSALTMDSRTDYNIHIDGGVHKHTSPIHNRSPLFHNVNALPPPTIGGKIASRKESMASIEKQEQRASMMASSTTSSTSSKKPGSSTKLTMTQQQDDDISIDPDTASNCDGSTHCLNKKASLEQLSMDAMDLFHSTM